MLLRCPRACLHYLVTIAVVLLAVYIRWATIPIFGFNTPYLTVYPAVIFVSVLFGIGPGILATLVGVWAIETWIPHPGGLPIFWTSAARLVIVMFSAIYLGYVGQRLRAARASARADADAARAAQHALSQSEERFRSITDTTPVIMWMTDAAGSIQFVNRAYREYFGVTLEQVARPEGWDPLLHPDDAAEYLGRFFEALRQRSHFHARTRVRRADGAWRWIESYGAPRFTDGGDFLGIAGSSPDITDRKLAEDALRDSETRFRMLADNMSQLAWMADEHGSIFWYNQRWYDYTGTSLAQVQGWGWQSVHHPDHVQRVVEKIRHCFENGLVWEDTFPLRGRDGSYRWFLSHAVPIRDPAGKVIRWFGTNTDVTDMRQRQREIQRLNRTLKALSDSSHAMSRARRESEFLADICRIIVEDCGHAMVWVGYAEHNPDRTVTPVAWWGFEDGYLEDLHVSWADTDLGRGPVGIAIRTGHTRICQDIHSDPRLAPWRAEAVQRGYSSLIALPLLSEGQAFGILVIYSREPDPFSGNEVRLLEELAGVLAYGIHAIRLRHANERAEAELRKAKEIAETANKAKDRFLAVLSHELRTPLNPALLAAAMVESSPALPPELRESAEVVRRNIELEARLIDDMLDLTRIARGKITLHRRLVDGCEVLRHAIETCRAPAAEKHLDLHVQIPNDPICVYADPARLQQVFWNLLSNAVKFTPHHGTITVTATPAPDRGMLALVADSGRGIERDALERIFMAFEQGRPDVTRQYGGLGLGLAICRSLVGMHGGTIRAASDGPGQGATFTVTLPPPPPQRTIRIAQPQPAARTPPPHEEGGRGAILLVEDDATTARVTARLLQHLGYRVSTADCVKGALEKFDQEPFDVLVSDLGLPDGTGQQLLRELLAKRPIRAIAVSGYGMDSDLQESACAGFIDHLVKPITPAQLEQAIDRALARPIHPPP